MTTIAYKDNIIAVDSRVTADDLIVSDNENKINIVGHLIYIFSGCLCDKEELINAYSGNVYSKDADISALIIDKKIVYLSSICRKDGFWKENITGKTYGLGGGADHALTAMDLGCSAKEAVKMAAKRHSKTGGKVRTLQVAT